MLKKDDIMVHLYEDEPGEKEGWAYKKRIRGWWKDSLFEIFDLINNFQEGNITANLCEIGTWYGRSFLPLRNMARPGELTVGVDVFCKGQKQEVEQTIRTCFGSLEGCLLIEGDSLDESIQNKIIDNLPYRLINIDGGHKYHQALSDLELSSTVLAEGGVMFLDDYTNHNFGNNVTRAITEFTRDSEFSVCFTSCLQAFICHDDFADSYVEAIRQLNWKEFKDPVFNVPNFEHPRGHNSWRRD